LHADAWLWSNARGCNVSLRQELAARMTKKRRVYRHHIAGNQVMRPADLGQISDCGWPGASRNA
jgi:hypothetical protein